MATKDKVCQNLLSVIGTIFCLVFGTIFLFNMSIIMQGSKDPSKPPSIFGITPMTINTDSMSGKAAGHIESGDLILSKKIDINLLKEGDVISYMDGKNMLTHRIVKIDSASGRLELTTKGDNNFAIDKSVATSDNLIGICTARIPKLGKFIMFLCKPLGVLIFVTIPLCFYIINDMIKKSKSRYSNSKREARMKSEIERLKSITKDESDIRT